MLGVVALSQLNWYVTRSTGLVAFALITASLVLGILGAERFETTRRPRIHYIELHRGVSLFGFTLLIVHILTAVLDPYTHLGLLTFFDPFGRPYRGLFLGIGVACFDVLAAVVVTSLVRQRMDPKVWKWVHLSVYPIWVGAVVHGLGTGTDSHFLVIEAIYVVALLAVVVASWLRILSGSVRHVGVRASAAALALIIPGMLVAWSLSGPTKANWASRFSSSTTTTSTTTTTIPTDR